MKDWFKMSMSEEKGYWVLNFLIGVLIVYRLVFLPHWNKTAFVEPLNYDSLIEILNREDTMASLPVEKENVEEIANLKTLTKKNSKFPFDPNKSTKDQLLELGFKEYQAKNLLSYINAGGKISTSDELFKIYGVDSVLVNSLIPYVQIAAVQVKRKSRPKTATTTIKVDLNKADTNVLKTLKGVGSYYAKKIVEYRDRLGGFISISQLMEIGRLDSMLLHNNKEIIVLDTTNTIKQIDLNTVDVKALAKHPYMRWKQAKALIAYREQHGPFLEIKQITNSVLIADEDYLKIAPYLKIGGNKN